jgi:uncharacterized protein (DUF1330 family)
VTRSTEKVKTKEVRTMTAYLIVEENVTDPEGFQKYRQGESQPPLHTLGEKSWQRVE